MEHKEAIGKIQKELADARAALEAQERRIHGLQSDLTQGKGAAWGTFAAQDNGSSNSPRGQRKELGSGTAAPHPYFGSRWTSYRADVRKVYTSGTARALCSDWRMEKSAMALYNKCHAITV